MAWTRPERKGLVDFRDLGLAEIQVRCACVFRDMLGARGLGNGKERGSTRQKAQRDLANSRLVVNSNLMEHATTG